MVSSSESVCSSLRRLRARSIVLKEGFLAAVENGLYRLLSRNLDA